MTSFREALRPLSVGMIREHHVLHIAAEFDPSASEETLAIARKQIVFWARKRSGAVFPEEALRGEGFDLHLPGRNSSAIRLRLADVDAWAIRQEDPDKSVPGRVWTTEAVVWKAKDSVARVAARLFVASPEEKLDVVVAGPGFIRQLIENCGLKSAGQRITETVKTIQSEEEFETLVDNLINPKRRLPIIVASTDAGVESRFRLDLSKLAIAASGIATVYSISAEDAWGLTKRFGKKLSVFNGAIRIAFPGFDEDADPFAHPLWLGERFAIASDAEVSEKQIRSRIAEFSIRNFRLGREILPFSQIRSLNDKLEQEHLQTSGASDRVKFEAARKQIESLESELSETKRLQDMAFEELAVAEGRATEAEASARTAIARLQHLLQATRTKSDDDTEKTSFPVHWDDVPEWCDQTFAGQLVLTTSAKKGCRKAHYSDLAQVCRSLVWLADEGRGRFIDGGGSLRDESVEPGIRNAWCGGDTYEFVYQGRKLEASWHIKTGGNSRAPENCLRIYYAWDEMTQQIIVSDMPAHRTTDAS